MGFANIEVESEVNNQELATPIQLENVPETRLLQWSDLHIYLNIKIKSKH